MENQFYESAAKNVGFWLLALVLLAVSGFVWTPVLTGEWFRPSSLFDVGYLLPVVALWAFVAGGTTVVRHRLGESTGE